MKKVKTGSKLPAFELPDQNGRLVNIHDLVGKKNLVIYFYPKDETPGCTKEACMFRDSYEDFTEAGAEVIGISADSVESHRNFAGRYQLPFTLLSDLKNEVRGLFGIPSGPLGLMPGRVTYVVDKKGIVRHVFSSQLNIGKHLETALGIIDELSGRNV